MKRNQKTIDRMTAIHAEVQRIVDSGKCPRCGGPIHPNYSITGWWQCDQYGAVTHRKNPNIPACDWQGFTC